MKFTTSITVIIIQLVVTKSRKIKKQSHLILTARNGYANMLAVTNKKAKFGK